MERQDKIILNGLRFYGYHGVYPEERKRGQWFELDVEIWGNFSQAAVSDNVLEALDYSQVYKSIERIIEGPSVNLLEHLTQLVIDEIMSFNKVEKTLVRIKKPKVSIGGPVLFAGVEMIGYKDES
jgi:dihydroneopterin aldolase